MHQTVNKGSFSMTDYKSKFFLCICSYLSTNFLWRRGIIQLAKNAKNILYVYALYIYVIAKNQNNI